MISDDFNKYPPKRCIHCAGVGNVHEINCRNNTNPKPMSRNFYLLDNAGDPLYIVHDNGQYGKRYKAGHDRDKALKLVGRLNCSARANVEEYESGLHVCWHDHERSQGCNYVQEIDYSDLPYRVAEAVSEQVLADNAKKWADLKICSECGGRDGNHVKFCPNDPNAENKHSAKAYIGWAETKYTDERMLKAKALENPFKLLSIIEDLQARITTLEKRIQGGTSA